MNGMSTCNANVRLYTLFLLDQSWHRCPTWPHCPLLQCCNPPSPKGFVDVAIHIQRIALWKSTTPRWNHHSLPRWTMLGIFSSDEAERFAPLRSYHRVHSEMSPQYSTSLRFRRRAEVALYGKSRCEMVREPFRNVSFKTSTQVSMQIIV